MNGALLEAFRHNAWATRHLLTFCRDLPAEQLTAQAAGTYGDIVATFNHIVRADGGYLRRLSGFDLAWLDEGAGDLDQLVARAEDAAPLWERYLAQPDDAERVIVVDKGASEVRAGVFVAQALHHGSSHREQICATLTSLGIQPPDVQAWGYAVATVRLWDRTPGETT